MLGVSGLAQPRSRRRFSDDEAGTRTLANVRRVINLRPASLWMLLVLWLLWRSGNAGATWVALAAFGTMTVRLWMARIERAERLRRRRWVWAFAAALLFLLGWQRGGGWWLQSTLDVWWPQWQAQWNDPWWRWALWAMLGSGIWVTTVTRNALRTYLAEAFSTRLLLAATAVGALPALIFFGPAGPVLLGLYPAGTVMYDLLYARSLSPSRTAWRRFGRRAPQTAD
jgi:hypothetical protein